MSHLPEKAGPAGSVQHLNPAGLHNMPDSWTNVVAVTGPVKTIYMSGLGAIDPSGNIIGPGDIKAQTAYILDILSIALEAAGARPEHIIKWSIYMTQGQSIEPVLEPLSRFWEDRPNPPASTVMYITAFEPPEFLIVIDAVAVVPLTS